MTIDEKFNTINRYGPAFLRRGYPLTTAETLEDFWNQFIVPRLPEPEVVIAWHKRLLDYVSRPGAVFAIRAFNEDNEEKIRRGFYSKVNDGEYSYFYTDNSFAYFFEKIMLDGDCVPSVDELYDFFVSQRIPYKYVIRGNKHNEKKFANAFPRSTKNPGVTKNYKLAHIYPDGEAFRLGEEIVGVASMTQKYFPRGRHSDWVRDENGIYVRNVDVDEADRAQAKKWIIAHFLRFIHPMNYFLAPKAPYQGRKYNSYVSHNGRHANDIGEYEVLLSFIKSKFLEIYKEPGHNYYKEFVSKILPTDQPERNVANEQINLTYASNPINVHHIHPVVQPQINRPRVQRQHNNAEDNTKVLKRIEKWANRTDSKVHKIIKAFVAESHNGKALVDNVRRRCSNPENTAFYLDGFSACLASLKTNAGNSYGKLFVEENGYLSIFEDVRELFEGVKGQFE